MDNTVSLLQFQRRLSRKAFTFSVAVALLIYLVGFVAIAKGFVLGALFSVINFVLMAHFLPYQITSERKRSTAMALVSILVRFGLLALPLTFAIKTESFNFFAVVAGLFTVPVAAFVDQWITQRFSRRGSDI